MLGWQIKQNDVISGVENQVLTPDFDIARNTRDVAERWGLCNLYRKNFVIKRALTVKERHYILATLYKCHDECILRNE